MITHEHYVLLCRKNFFLSDFFGTNSIKMGTVQWRMNGKTVLCYCSCWGLVCDLPPHGVSVVQSRKVWSKNCNWNLLHHRSEAVHQTEHAGLGLIKYKNLSSAMTNSRVWLGNGIQFPSLAENRCWRQLFFCPITHLAPWKWSQHLLTFLSACQRNRNAGEKGKKRCGEIQTIHAGDENLTDIPQTIISSVPGFVHTYYLLTERF